MCVGDGVSDRDEYPAGTDPKDPNDYLRITSITHGTPTPTYTTLRWTSKPTRFYAIQDRHALDAGSAWEDFSVLPVAGANNAIFDESDSQRFCRIRAFRPLAP